MNKAVSLIVALVLTLTILFPALPTERAHAAYPVVEVGNNLIQNTIAATGVTSLFEIELTELNTEQFLDGLAWKIAKIAIAQMTDSIVSWINSGFEGSPAFVTNLSGFLLDIADQAAGDFIYNGPLQALCSPFRIDVQFALAVQYQENRDAGQKLACRLTDVVDNVQGSLSQSMNNWGDWFNVTLIPQNNLYGALLLAQHEMGLTITSAQGEQASLLNFGEGFLSFQKCEAVEGGGEKCTIVKPGQMIEEQLEHVLGSGVRQLELADKINEVIDALLAQLLQQVMTGINGLQGVSAGSYNGGASYLEQMSEQAAAGTGAVIGFESNPQTNPISEALSVESDWLALNEEVVGLVEDAEAILQRAGSCTSRSLPSTFRSAKANAEEEIINANSTIDELTALQNQLSTATTPEEEAAVFERYTQLQGSGLIHTESDVILLEVEVDELAEDVSRFINLVQRDINNCSSNSGGNVGSEA